MLFRSNEDDMKVTVCGVPALAMVFVAGAPAPTDREHALLWRIEAGDAWLGL